MIYSFTKTTSRKKKFPKRRAGDRGSIVWYICMWGLLFFSYHLPGFPGNAFSIDCCLAVCWLSLEMDNRHSVEESIQSFWAAITEYLDRISLIAFISHGSGGWKVQDKNPADTVSGEGSLPASEQPFLCILSDRQERNHCCHVTSHKGSNSIYMGSTLMTQSSPKGITS